MIAEEGQKWRRKKKLRHNTLSSNQIFTLTMEQQPNYLQITVLFLIYWIMLVMQHLLLEMLFANGLLNQVVKTYPRTISWHCSQWQPWIKLAILSILIHRQYHVIWNTKFIQISLAIRKLRGHRDWTSLKESAALLQGLYDPLYLIAPPSFLLPTNYWLHYYYTKLLFCANALHSWNQLQG